MSTQPGRRSLGVLLGLVLLAAAGMQWWGAGQEQRQGQRLAALAQQGDIRMVSSETCIYCGAARRWMTEHRVPFDECFIERDAPCQALYDATGAQGTPTLLVRGQVQLGFNVTRLLATLEARG